MRSAALVGLVALACSKHGDEAGGATPEAPLRELAKAALTGDAAAMQHALVTPERLRKALRCPDDKPFELLRAARAATTSFGSLDLRFEVSKLRQQDLTRIAKGDRFRGCVANEAFEVRTYEYDLMLDMLGSTTHTTERAQVIRLDGRWFALTKEP